MGGVVALQRIPDDIHNSLKDAFNVTILFIFVSRFDSLDLGVRKKVGRVEIPC